MEKTNFTSYKQYLLGLLLSRNAKKTHAAQSIMKCFYSLRKERTHDLQKKQLQKLFLQCVLSVQLASMNAFTSYDK